MATFHDAAVLAASQDRRFGLVGASFRVEQRELAIKIADVMLDLTSGGISTAELKRRGHPFGKGKGRISLSLKEGGRSRRYRTFKPPLVITPTPLLPINKQRGTLQRSLRVIPEHYGDRTSFRVQFTAPHAKYVLKRGGTALMVDRGYWPELRIRAQKLKAKSIYQMRLNELRIMYGNG